VLQQGQLCSLQRAAGFREPCPGKGCRFWEEGGALLPAGCVIERLGLNPTARPEPAAALRGLRFRFDSCARPEADLALAAFE